MAVGTRAVLCLALAGAAWPAPATAQAFLDEYKEGVEAAEDGRWAEAERRMRQAIDGRPEESHRLVRFLHFRPYLPHLYLGLALAEQDRCEAALEALAESERQGVVPELDEEHRRLREARERCRERLSTEEDARRRREELAEALERARDVRAAIRAITPDGGPGGGEAEPEAPGGGERDLAAAWKRGDPSLAERLEAAEADLERATAALTNEPERPDVLDAIADLTRSVLTRLEGIQTEAELRREALRSRRDAAVERVAAARRRARELVASTGALAEGVDVVARRRAALEEVVDRAAGVESGSDLTLDELAAVERSLEGRIVALAAVAEPPPDRLVEAAGAWLDGRPRDVLQLLSEPAGGERESEPDSGTGNEAETDSETEPESEGEDETGSEAEGGAGSEAEAEAGSEDSGGEGDSPLAALDDRGRAHALLLRAAAAFDLFHAGGGREPDLLERARRDVRECRRLAPALAPLPRAFSPRFRRFFDAAEPPEPPEPDPEG